MSGEEAQILRLQLTQRAVTLSERRNIFPSFKKVLVVEAHKDSFVILENGEKNNYHQMHCLLLNFLR